MTRNSRYKPGFDGPDARFAKSQQYQKNYDDILEMLGGTVDPVVDELIKRTASAMIINQQFDRDLAEGRKVNKDEYNRSTNTYRGLCRELGLMPDQKSIKSKPPAVLPEGEDGRYTAQQITDLEADHPGNYSLVYGPLRDGGGYHIDPDGVVRDLNDDSMDDLVDYEAINGHPGERD